MTLAMNWDTLQQMEDALPEFTDDDEKEQYTEIMEDTDALHITDLIDWVVEQDLSLGTMFAIIVCEFILLC